MLLNLMLLNRLIPKIYLISRKNQNGFRTNRSTSAKILTIQHILEGAKSINLPATLLFIEFPRLLTQYIENVKKKYLHTGASKKGRYKYVVSWHSFYGTLSTYKHSFLPYLLGSKETHWHLYHLPWLCTKNVLDKNKDFGFTLTKQRSRRHPAIKVTDADYTDDLAIIVDLKGCNSSPSQH